MSSAGEFFRSAEGNALSGSARQLDAWREVAAPTIQHEDRMDRQTADDCWNKVFGLFSASGEEMRKEIRLGCYAYFAVNGTSRYGEYDKDIRIGSGSACPAKDVTMVVGLTRLRQFCRADVSDAYFALRGSGVLQNDPVAAARARALGCPVGQEYLMADYLRHCPEFTAKEADLYERLFERGIARAGANRGGKTVEDLSREADNRMVNAQRNAAMQAQHNGDVL